MKTTHQHLASVTGDKTIGKNAVKRSVARAASYKENAANREFNINVSNRQVRRLYAFQFAFRDIVGDRSERRSRARIQSKPVQEG